VVRTRDGVRCYLPESQTVKVERASAGTQREFPAILPDRLADLPQHYVATRGQSARIAGFDCVSVQLTPRDDLRHGYVLWADANTGMLLRARTINEKGETLEQFTFTQLQIGPVARDKVKPRHAGEKLARRGCGGGAGRSFGSRLGPSTPTFPGSARSASCAAGCANRCSSGRSSIQTAWLQYRCSSSR
jgi:hypothetical protein